MNTVQSENQYNDAANRVGNAYTAFRQTYELMIPPPILPTKAKSVLGWKQGSMFLGLIGAIIVSASHTIPVFVGSNDLSLFNIIIGFAAFVMVEFGITVFAYSSTEQQHKTHEDIRSRVKHFTRNGLYFIVSVAIAANVVYVIEKNVTIPPAIMVLWNGFRLVIYLAVGLSAPIMAFLAGEILAVDVLEHNSRHNRLLEQYRLELQTWQDGLNRSWSNQKKRWGAEVDLETRVSRLSDDGIPMSNLSVYSDRQQTDNRRVSSAVDKTLSYLKDNPDALKLSVREIAEQVGVGKDSAAKAKKMLSGNDSTDEN